MCNALKKIKCTLMKCHTNVNSTPPTESPHKFSYIVAIFIHNHFESHNMHLFSKSRVFTKIRFFFFTCLPSSLSFFVHFRKLFLRLDHVLRTVFKKISFVFLSLVNLSFHKIFFSAISLSSGNFRHCIHFCTSFYITRINQNMLLFF
jgi:hypothetical protein